MHRVMGTLQKNGTLPLWTYGPSCHTVPTVSIRPVVSTTSVPAGAAWAVGPPQDRQGTRAEQKTLPPAENRAEGLSECADGLPHVTRRYII